MANCSTARSRSRRSPSAAGRGDDRSAQNVARRCAELEALVLRVQEFWRGQLAEQRERYEATIARKDARIAFLRRKLNDLEDRATRRPDGAPKPRIVRKAWREAWKATGSLKGALLELERLHGWRPRMVERVIADTDAELAEWMGITVARLREIDGRLPPRRESSDT